jgi:hypothetical protein
VFKNKKIRFKTGKQEELQILTIKWFLAFFRVVASIQIFPLSNTAAKVVQKTEMCKYFPKKGAKKV